jgi:hypothetical protein
VLSRLTPAAATPPPYLTPRQNEAVGSGTAPSPRMALSRSAPTPVSLTPRSGRDLNGSWTGSNPVPASFAMNGSSAGQPGTYDVDVQAGPQSRDVELLKGSACLPASAGHQHIEPAVTGQDPFDQVHHARSSVTSQARPCTVTPVWAPKRAAVQRHRQFEDQELNRCPSSHDRRPELGNHNNSPVSRWYDLCPADHLVAQNPLPS